MAQVFNYDDYLDSNNMPANLRRELDKLTPNQHLALGALLISMARSCERKIAEQIAGMTLAGDVHCTRAIRFSARKEMLDELGDFLGEIREQAVKRTKTVE